MAGVDSGYDLAVAAAEAEADAQRTLNESISRNREEHRRQWEKSEVADAHRQIQEAERIMHLPTPEAHKALRSVIGDPRKGPSS